MNDLEQQPDQFGGCTDCGGASGFVVFGNDLYRVCLDHLKRWHVINAEFFHAPQESKEQLTVKATTLSRLEVVKPRYQKLGIDERRLARLGRSASSDTQESTA